MAAIVGLTVAVVIMTSGAAQADDAFDCTTFKAMSDYLGSQAIFGLEYDSTLDVVTEDGQKLALASSGTVSL